MMHNTDSFVSHFLCLLSCIYNIQKSHHPLNIPGKSLGNPPKGSTTKASQTAPIMYGNHQAPTHR